MGLEYHSIGKGPAPPEEMVLGVDARDEGTLYSCSVLVVFSQSMRGGKYYIENCILIKNLRYYTYFFNERVYSHFTTSLFHLTRNNV